MLPASTCTAWHATQADRLGPKLSANTPHTCKAIYARLYMQGCTCKALLAAVLATVLAAGQFAGQCTCWTGAAWHWASCRVHMHACAEACMAPRALTNAAFVTHNDCMGCFPAVN